MALPTERITAKADYATLWLEPGGAGWKATYVLQTSAGQSKPRELGPLADERAARIAAYREIQARLLNGIHQGFVDLGPLAEAIRDKLDGLNQQELFS